MRSKAGALLTKRAEVVYLDGTQVFGRLRERDGAIAIDPVAENRPGDWHEPIILDFDVIKEIIPVESS